MTIENIEKRSRQLMDSYGLQDWSFGFDRGVRRLGATHWHTKRITLSTQFAMRNTWAQVKETVLHEIAHALCDVNAGHGRVWAETYASIGGTVNRDYTILKMPPLKIGHCPNCKRVVKKHRRSSVACGACCNKFNGGKYDAAYKIIWRK